MFPHLQIDDPTERRLVGIADIALRLLLLPDRLRRSRAAETPSRILVFRLERVGDLLMARPGLRWLRRRFPDARIDLVVGSWNAALARLFPDIDGVETLDLPWIARGDRPSTMRSFLERVRAWRRARYDLGVNFEGDIRSHLLLRASGARTRAGFSQAGGGPLLDTIAPYDPRQHSSWNILQLAALAGGGGPTAADLTMPPLALPDDARSFAARALADTAAAPKLIGVHPSGGRRIKQWPPEGLARVAADLARREGAAVVVTGSPADRPVVDAFRAAFASDVRLVDLTGRLDLVQLAAVLQRLDLFLGCDSGPLHLACAVGTPVLGVFGPSDPARWGPLGIRFAVARAELPCSPCNRIRQPPRRCRDRVPDCLDAVGTRDVMRAAERLLAASTGGGSSAGT